MQHFRTSLVGLALILSATCLTGQTPRDTVPTVVRAFVSATPGGNVAAKFSNCSWARSAPAWSECSRPRSVWRPL